jgi:hypothetical protein
MSNYSFLVRNRSLPDISYRTDPPEELVHPRIIDRDDGPYVYCQKVHVRLDVFLKRLASGETGLWVAGYRANGRQTTISFSKSDRVQISESLQAELAKLARKAHSSGNVLSESKSPPNSQLDTARSHRAMTLPELETKLGQQREIGRLGEEAAYRHEYERLVKLGCKSPRDCIEIISAVDVAAGYDLKSTYAGEIRFIEVKASTSREDSFFISENERAQLEVLGEQAFIYLVRVDKNDPKRSFVFREIHNPFGSKAQISLQPLAWRADVNEDNEASMK